MIGQKQGTEKMVGGVEEGLFVKKKKNDMKKK
jgi:hypothetical protein